METKSWADKNRWIASDKSTRIPISTFQLALELHGVIVDVDEVECMLANMVYRVSSYLRSFNLFFDMP
jgi:hypothetical protein